MKRAILALAMGLTVLALAAALTSERAFTNRRMAQTMIQTPETQQTNTAEPSASPSAAAVPKASRQPEQTSKTEQTSGGREPEIYAVFGVDTEEGDSGRSDCILLASLDGQTLRLCSLARDTLVTLGDQSQETKLGHAYAYGGPEEALDTINHSFGLNVTRYAAVNFSQMPQLVDLLGGVEVQLSREEWSYMDLSGPYLGRTSLDGQESLNYCRLRALDSDDMRMLRQRKVAAAMVSALKDVKLSQLPALAASGLKLCRTNLTMPEMVALGTHLLEAGDRLTVETLSIPGNTVDAWGGLREDGVWYYVYDLEEASTALQSFFSGEAAEPAVAVDGIGMESQAGS